VVDISVKKLSVAVQARGGHQAGMVVVVAARGANGLKIVRG